MSAHLLNYYFDFVIRNLQLRGQTNPSGLNDLFDFIIVLETISIRYYLPVSSTHIDLIHCVKTLHIHL